MKYSARKWNLVELLRATVPASDTQRLCLRTTTIVHAVAGKRCPTTDAVTVQPMRKILIRSCKTKSSYGAKPPLSHAWELGSTSINRGKRFTDERLVRCALMSALPKRVSKDLVNPVGDGIVR